MFTTFKCIKQAVKHFYKNVHLRRATQGSEYTFATLLLRRSFFHNL